MGTLIGVLPGIGALVAISLLFPITLHLDTTPALVMLAGIFYGSTYGGSTASILLNVPGTPSAAIACLDGYPMSRQGRAGVALLMTTVACFVGGSIGIVLMMALSPLIAQTAVRFGSPEYFGLIVLGLVAASTISTGLPAKGITMTLLGIFLGLVQADPHTGIPRFNFGLMELHDGISLVALAMGLFGVSEVIASIKSVRGGVVDRGSVTFRSMIPSRDDVRRSVLPMLRGSGVGAFFGTLPGTGGLISAFMSYALEKRVSRHPEKFGKGAIEGLMGPEAANNAADQTAFIPTLTLGIPGTPTMAIILGVLMVHGITPGPNLVVQRPDLFWGLVMSFWIGNLMLLVLNIPLIGLWIRLLLVPYHYLYPAILVFVCVGVYSQPLRRAGRLRVRHCGLRDADQRLSGSTAASRLRSGPDNGGALPPCPRDRARRFRDLLRETDQRRRARGGNPDTRVGRDCGVCFWPKAEDRRSGLTPSGGADSGQPEGTSRTRPKVGLTGRSAHRY